MVIASPLNYTGGKYKLLPQILPLFPKKIETFVDLFCGGCNVGLNVEAERVIYNDIDRNLLYLYNTFKNLEKESTFEWVYQIIRDFGLSLVSENGYDFYSCDSSKGLADYNREGFMRLRTELNRRINAGQEDYYFYVMLYVTIVYAFNNQIRFNGQGEYNLPVGKRDFNEKMKGKLSGFIDRVQIQNCKFTCQDFRDVDTSALSSRDFVYADPPYLITCATYNEQGGWQEKDERDLLSFLDALHGRGIKFALSNVLRSKGRANHILLKWLDNHVQEYKAIPLDFNYSNSNYHTKDRTTGSEEVLIVNYETGE